MKKLIIAFCLAAAPLAAHADDRTKDPRIRACYADGFFMRVNPTKKQCKAIIRRCGANEACVMAAFKR